MHVQRHSFNVTFTLKSVVESIAAHITGTLEAEILLMLRDGHTGYRRNRTLKIITAGVKLTACKETKNTFEINKKNNMEKQITFN